jgi:Ca2+-binding EF-hand superfamily protein
MAKAMFDAIDTKGQGFIEKSDLATALQGLSQSGKQNTLSVDDAFKQLDTNGDGQITKQEFADDLKAMLANMQSQMQAGGKPPPPPATDTTAESSAAGLSQDYLSSVASAEANANRKSQLDDLIANFSTIDSNADKQISAKEVLAYKQAQLSAQKSGASSSTKLSKSEEAEAKLLRVIMQISRSYGVAASATATAASTAGSSVSVAA